MLRAEWTPYKLRFAFTARTSREVLHEKQTYILKVSDGVRTGVGEVSLFPSLQPSFSGLSLFEKELNEICQDINRFSQQDVVHPNSAIAFGVETALGALKFGKFSPFGKNQWNTGERKFLINGLIWMNDITKMEEHIAEKLVAGYKCLKLKIGANNFEKELELLSDIRKTFPKEQLEIRLDANGCFKSDDVLYSLERISHYDIHSIEQPLPRDSAAMKFTISRSPIPIALDEDMIERFWNVDRMTDWLGDLCPSYIILKPSLVGGFKMADRWIEVAGKLGIGWWATSALESNIGLNAIGQWLASRDDAWNTRHGLGTGQIYLNNFESPIFLDGEYLGYSPTKKWQEI